MDLSLLIDAYCNGIFPWTEEPVCWFSLTHAVFELDRVRLPVRIGKLLRRYAYTITFDEAFSDVMKICADVPRKHEVAGLAGFSATIASCATGLRPQY